jgi:hypothetical protein
MQNWLALNPIDKFTRGKDVPLTSEYHHGKIHRYEHIRNEHRSIA